METFDEQTSVQISGLGAKCSQRLCGILISSLIPIGIYKIPRKRYQY